MKLHHKLDAPSREQLAVRGICFEVKRLKFTLLSICLLSLGAQGFSQKVEREYGIDRDEVPSRAITWIDSAFAEHRRMNWYLDQGEDGTTIEAKFKFNDAWHSIEFDRKGDWLDTEVEMPADEVEEIVWSQVCGAWGKRYGRFRIARVQFHLGRGGETFYEVELRARKDFEWERYEVKLDPQGVVLEEKVIELAPGHLDRW